jgi:hypothetical protein
MNKAIRLGTVFAGARAPDTHNEIVKIFMSREYGHNGRYVKMVEVEQYGTTLANKETNRKVIFFAREINQMLNRGIAHLILVREDGWQLPA